ncbi:DUF3040 domain-containing protein [Streptomyces sp. CB03234]|uniref:DUF3040 domain-containing protein n=1 Tax=Streptomyces sp. (strain CB03234) TaxID=1703937 RepID=UPI00093B373B|nr:DUF3040 domain-containing protein [Streptomyces sp. CB03234]
MEHESEGRILAQIERRLTSDDPELAARMNTLNEQFSEGQEARQRREGQGSEPLAPERNRHRRTLLILVVIALVGLLLTAILNASSNESPAPPGSTTPAVSARPLA